ncbi:metal ABC transporter substrate-binding protein [Trueperella sp. LYQ141]|uniref:metal ABC transporter substrate-binding protein n=1 Tax=Trueperella sp. LYQ141 TaxID=3391058 RepID=UPI003982EAB5
MNIKKYCALAAGALLALAGCSDTTSSSESGSSSASGTLAVTTSFYPLAYLVTQIGGEHVTVTDLTPPGSDAHDLELSPREIADMQKADLIFYVAKLSHAIDDAVESSGVKNAVNIGDSVNLLEYTEITKATGAQATGAQATGAQATDEHDHEHDHAAGSTDEHGDHDHDKDSAEKESGSHDHDSADATQDKHDEHSDHDHDGHDHGTRDPHFWTDPSRMARAADTVTQELVKLDPDHKADYEKNLASVKDKLSKLSADIAKITPSQCRTNAFVVSHQAFSYLAVQAKLTQIGISGFDPESEPSPARVREISDLAKAHKIDTIFAATDGEMKAAKAIADEAGVKVEILDALESQRDPSKDYIAVMSHNIELLQNSMGCQK